MEIRYSYMACRSHKNPKDTVRSKMVDREYVSGEYMGNIRYTEIRDGAAYNEGDITKSFLFKTYTAALQYFMHSEEAGL